MKIKKSQLRLIIKEEIELILEDGNLTLKDVEEGLGLTAGTAVDEWERLSKLPQKDYPDKLKKYLGIALDESAPFHDFSDEDSGIDYDNLCTMPDWALIDIADRDVIEGHRYLDDDYQIIDQKNRAALIDQIENV